MFLPLLWMLATVPPAPVPTPPDVLVICPAELRPALAPWEAYRRDQGYTVQIVDAPASADGVTAAIGQTYRQGRLKYVVLIGDVAADRRAAHGGAPPVVPTGYVPARINVRWGSEPTIATDGPYADVDGDRLPDVAVGRIPADSPVELAAFVRKVIRYEQQADAGPWQRQIKVVAGVGGFGPLADTLIEAAARCVFQQTVPDGYNVQATLANPAAGSQSPAGGMRWQARQELSGGCLAWVYLGHGLPTELDHVRTPTGEEPILSVDDAALLRCGAASPLAVLVACYTGALDAPSDCLAERLAMANQGPVAVIAATRVTMPYGNTVLGCELLRACFSEPDAVLGDVWRQAQRRTLADTEDDPLRTSLDALARGVSPPVAAATGVEGPVNLAAERQEHVWMYQLLGDPLLRLQRPGELRLQSPSVVAAGQVLSITGQSGVSGRCTVELLAAGARAGNDVALATAHQPVEAGAFYATLTVPAGAEGRCTVCAFVSGAEGAALGAANVTVHRAAERTAQANADRAIK
jgi:hypothetical protein